MPFSERELEEHYPWIPWRQPWEARHPNGDHVFMCRFCIAQYGLDFKENVSSLYRTREVFEEHLAMFHPKERRVTQ